MIATQKVFLSACDRSRRVRRATAALCILVCALFATSPFFLFPAAASASSKDATWAAGEPKAAAADDRALGFLKDTCEILVLHNGRLDPAIKDMIVRGFKAVMYAMNFKTEYDQTITIIDSKIYDPTATGDINTVVKAVMQDYPDLFLIFGPFSGSALSEAMNAPVVLENDLVLFAPFTGSSQVRYWSPNVFFTRADPATEMLALINIHVFRLRHRRIGFMYLTGADYGELQYALAEEQITRQNRSTFAVYTKPYDDEHTDVDWEAFEAFASQRPQTILIFTNPRDQTRKFIEACLNDPRTAGATFMTSSFGQMQLLTVYHNMREVGQREQVFVTSTAVLPNQLEYDYINVFLDDMDVFFQEVEDLGPEAVDMILDNASAGMLLLTGWIAGRSFENVMMRDMWRDRHAFISNMFGQQSFLIADDLFLGDYGPERSELAIEQGAVSACNQGGRAAYVSFLNETFHLEPLPDETFQIPRIKCYTAGTDVPLATYVLVLNYTDIPYLSSIWDGMSEMLTILSDAASHTDQRVSTTLIPVTRRHTRQVMEDYGDDFYADVLIGPVLDEISYSRNSLLAFDPMMARPTVAEFDPNVVRLTPTLEQQIFMLYSYLSSSTSKFKTSKPQDVKVVLYSMVSEVETERIIEVFEKSAITYRMDKPSITVRYNDTDEDPTSLLATEGTNVLIGINEKTPAQLAKFLTKNRDATVFIVYHDFSGYYEQIEGAFSKIAEGVRSRLIFMTNLPMWVLPKRRSAASERPLMQGYWEATLKATHPPSPKTLDAYIAFRFLQELMEDMDYIKAYSLRTKLYQLMMLTVENTITFGPFNWCTDDDIARGNCVNSNAGARDIRVATMQDVYEPEEVEPLYGPDTPSMDYVDAEVETDIGKIVGIIAGVAGALLLVGALIFLYCFFFTGTRAKNRIAPKDPTHSVTLVFTDIESSTALWAAIPQEMPEIIATHHRLIRGVIKQYGCYEVKTIGDSFMIACKTAQAAVAMVGEIQRRLYTHDWGTEEVDGSYRTFELVKAEMDEEYKPPSALLTPEEYKERWSGVRVRVGIHTGLSDIRFDPVAKIYDYYGDTSNMAARTEAVAHGGQVILTEAAWWALTHAQRAVLKAVSLGPQPLRGVPHPVEMFQLTTIEGREHPPLRTEIDAYLPNEADEDDPDALLSSAGTLDGASAAIATVLDSFFSPFLIDQRLKELALAMSKWLVPVPPRSPQIDKEDYYRALLARLAVKISSVSQARGRIHGGAGGNSHASTMLNSRLGGGAGAATVMNDSRLSAIIPALNPLNAQNLFRPPTRGDGAAPAGPPQRRASGTMVQLAEEMARSYNTGKLGGTHPHMEASGSGMLRAGNSSTTHRVTVPGILATRGVLENTNNALFLASLSSTMEVKHHLDNSHMHVSVVCPPEASPPRQVPQPPVTITIGSSTGLKMSDSNPLSRTTRRRSEQSEGRRESHMYVDKVNFLSQE